ncbi:MAG: hypothetical protein Kow0075_10770 [Salibacteraceae bacterium]
MKKVIPAGRSKFRQQNTKPTESQFGTGGFELCLRLSQPADRVAKHAIQWLENQPRARIVKKGKLKIAGNWLTDQSTFDLKISNCGDHACELRLKHDNLPNANDAHIMKTFWQEELSHALVSL